MDPNCWSPQERISREDNDKLTCAFSEEEINRVIFSMEMNTTPGPDHIPVEFFQACWEVLESDIMRMFLEFFEHKIDLEKLNYGTITLIPKLKNANQIQ
jgi:hypothetical protein